MLRVDGARDAGHRTGIAVVTMTAGALLISGSYAAGRSGSGGAAWVTVFWSGQAALFAPLAWRALSRARLGEADAVLLVLTAATATYLVKVCYSPSAFGFPDELEHWRTTVNVLGSHHLFGVNYLLPVSPVYPGLETVTAALVSVTGLPVFIAGLIVAGIARLVFTVALYLVFRLVSGSARIALGACAIYLTNPHYQVFDAIYGYQTLGLAFFGLALIAALGVARQGATDRVRWWVLALALVAVTVVTHHVTSYVLAGALLLLAATGLARRRAEALLVPLAVACAGLIALWLVLVASGTAGYLAPTLRSVADGLASGLTGHAAAGGGGAPVGPLADQVAGYAATVLIMIGLPFGWWRIWRTRRRDTWALALGAAAASYYVLTLVRVTAPDGAELAGRALTFVYIPVSYTLAMAVASPVLARLRRLSLAALAAVAAAILVSGGIASGWPPFWERLPGRYLVDGFESGITPEGVAAATWARDVLGPGRRISADYTSYLLLGSYGGQDAVGNIDRFYCQPAWTIVDDGIASQQDIGYLLVDLRMSEQRSVAGGYFSGPSPGCPSPIPRAYLTKFDAIPGASRVYDSGNIVVYAIAGIRG